MAQDPLQAETNLKLTLDTIERQPELEPEVRSQLRQQIENAIRLARTQERVVEERVAAAQEKRATAQELERVNDALALQTQRIKQLVDRFDALMDEGRYDIADEEIVPEVQKLAMDAPIEYSMYIGVVFSGPCATTKLCGATATTCSSGQCLPLNSRWFPSRPNRRSSISPRINGPT